MIIKLILRLLPATKLEQLIAYAIEERAKRPERHPKHPPDNTVVLRWFTWAIEQHSQERAVLTFLAHGLGYIGFEFTEQDMVSLSQALAPRTEQPPRIGRIN